MTVPPTTTTTEPAPPGEVLHAFGFAGAPVLLPGGQGGTWRVGDAVVKAVDDEAETSWLGSVLSELRTDGFRLARPRAATDGRWVVDGWAAWERVDGEPATDRWPEVLAVGRRFSATLAPVPPPDLLRHRRHRWAVADRGAWGEEAVDVPAPVRPLADRLSAAMRPLDLPAQLVHGDLAGNVLFADGQDPAVIDVSPYVRPAGWTLAVVAVDALAWSGADPALLDELRDEPGADQLLIRAVLFRLLAAADPEAERRAYEPVADLVVSG
jgi:uncharacterized protein (TIGR02569 family)